MPQSKRQILKDFELTEISGVDRPAQPTALVTIIKRDAPEMTTETAATILSTHIKKNYYNDSARSFSQVAFDRHIREQMWPLSDILRTSIRSIMEDPNLTNDQRKLAIDESTAAYAGKLKELLGSDQAVMKFATDIVKNSTQETTTVSDDVLKRLEKLEAENTANTILAKMSDAEKAYMAGMDEETKKAFMAMTEEERKKKMTKRDDETLAIGDQVISKSAVGDAAFEGLKAQQSIIAKQADAIKKAQDAAEMATLRKRADDEFGILPGTTDERAAILKAMVSMEDSARKSLETILKSAQEVAKKATESQGLNVTIDPVTKNANEQLETLTKKHQEIHKCDYYSAYNAVIEANPALYEKTLN